MEIINLQKQREKIKRATYNIEEIAKLLGVSYKLASKLVHSKGFPKIQIGRRILVPKDLFWDWLKTNPEIKI
ncbi:DNA binding domain protein, excisionase family [Caldicellulosiruptor acetigenus I77R1B]|uniref:DNA binding domain protein, excisionase family n=3 Tax=Caldicellulosiruptor acetigenus TaxID=301953 RepID=G2PT59_9FIRM|nr:helix-turn-helix domain-containing protein [Caldicellulosiruptor acetigenus]ADQ40246.1 DNA binding domain protein, excisionase family [Caldicellulosiruptor acetigenus I77R1B]AEM74218.1 DNA binding domain protein, excisionase family [Caldicellulosiruptor acetigenus 6A]